MIATIKTLTNKITVVENYQGKIVMFKDAVNQHRQERLEFVDRNELHEFMAKMYEYLPIKKVQVGVPYE